MGAKHPFVPFRFAELPEEEMRRRAREFYETMNRRRTVRDFSDRRVPREIVEDAIRTAGTAPSGAHKQPWHFVVIDDRDTLCEIPKFHPYSMMLKEAPLAILICGDLNLEQYEGYWVQDCSAATQNLLLAAHAKGLGAVWLGIHPDEERVIGMRKLLGIPDNVTPLSLVAIGHPAERKPRENRYDASRVHRNKW